MKKKQYLDILTSNIVEVIFTKLDGNERVMTCTLKEEYLPVKTTVRGEKIESEVNGDAVIENRGNITSTDDTQPHTLKVWDLEVNGWRSFRIDSIKSFQPLA